MRWVTRVQCHVDRAACAWLIQRFIDPEATFVFVADPDDAPEDAVAFDMRGADLSHRGGDCSFETFLDHYELRDPGLRELAHIVHEADLRDERFDSPEAPGLDALLRGLALRHGDEELLEITAPLFDALHAWCRLGLDAVPNQSYS